MSDTSVQSDWKDEANSVIRDIRQHVSKVGLSKLPSQNRKIYFNLTTLERKDFCVELTPAGFRIVGEKYDSTQQQGKYSIFETPYSLLDSLSPAYRNSFKEELSERLTLLQKEMSRKNEEDKG